MCGVLGRGGNTDSEHGGERFWGQLATGGKCGPQSSNEGTGHGDRGAL